MGLVCVLLTIATLIMCLISLIWNSQIIVTNSDMDERGHALFHLLKTFVVVPTVVLLIFVFASHLRCDDARATWEVKPHFGSECKNFISKSPVQKSLTPEAEPQQGPTRR